jgi:hypothetical protein
MTQVNTDNHSGRGQSDADRQSVSVENSRSALMQSLADRGVDYVRAEYTGRFGSGFFNQVLLCTDDGRQTYVQTRFLPRKSGPCCWDCWPRATRIGVEGTVPAAIFGGDSIRTSSRIAITRSAIRSTASPITASSG